MRANTKKQFFHIVEYYTNNNMVEERTISEVSDITKYWQELKKQYSEFENGFVELDSFVMVSKCVREYDYSITKIIERITIDKNN
jgi:pyruvate carboxylase